MFGGRLARTRLDLCFSGKFALVSMSRKTTMNILEQEINKSRININAPKSMQVGIHGFFKIIDPSQW